jgi:hypothetical protein
MKRVLASAMCVLLAACAHAPAPGARARPVVPPAALLPASTLGFDFQWRQRVSASWPSGKQSFDAVLQKQKGELILVGLSPLGLPGFVLRLRESGALEVENRTGQDLPFEPAYVLSDVQRVFFAWLPAPAPGWSGEQRGQRGDVQVVETYAAGRLAGRSFERQTPAGIERVTVSYGPLAPGADAPSVAELHNPLLGYALRIDTLEQSRLP